MPDDKRLSEFESEFKRYQGQKTRKVGGVEPRVLQNLAMYVGEQWVHHEKGYIKQKRPRRDEKGRITEVNLVLNMIAPRLQKIYGRLTASNPSFRAFPDSQDPSKMAMAEVATKGNRALNQRLDEPYLDWQRWFWKMMGGVCVDHIPWRPNSQIDTTEKLDENGNPVWLYQPSGQEVPHEIFLQATTSGFDNSGQPVPQEHFRIATEIQEIGDVGGEIIGPLNLFGPNSITQVEQLSPGESIMIANVRMQEWIKKTWPNADTEDLEPQDDFKIVTTRIDEQISFVNTSLRDLIPVVQGAAGENDPAMNVVVERYEPVSAEFPQGWSAEPDAATGPGFVPAPDDSFANGGRYTVFIPGRTVLRDGEIPYEDGIPIVDSRWDVGAVNFWSPDWATNLNGPQKSINVLASQMRQLSNARIFDPILMDEDVTPPETDSPKYWPGGIRDGQRMAERLGASGIDPTYVQQFEMLVSIFNDLAGGEDLFSEKRFPGQLRGTGAVAILQEVMDTQWGPKLRHHYDRLGKVYHKRLMRMKQFYPPVRTMRYTDTRGKVEVFKFHAQDILNAGVDYTISFEESSIMPETRRERFARVNEILSGPMAGLLMNPRTGQVDWTRVASMLQFGDVEDRETKAAKDVRFAKSVIEAMKEGRKTPPVLPFQNHLVFIDELEQEMNDEDFFKILSPETQQRILDRYQQHQQALQQAQQAQQQAVVNQETIDLVRQSVQQSLAQFQGELVKQLQQAGINPMDPRQGGQQSPSAAAAQLLGQPPGSQQQQ